jgi:hypothetical protein
MFLLPMTVGVMERVMESVINPSLEDKTPSSVSMFSVSLVSSI